MDQTNKFIPNPSEEYYVMPIVITLQSADAERAKQYYCNTLGFHSIFDIKNPGREELALSHIRREKYQDIILVKAKNGTKKN